MLRNSKSIQLPTTIPTPVPTPDETRYDECEKKGFFSQIIDKLNPVSLALATMGPSPAVYGIKITTQGGLPCTYKIEVKIISPDPSTSYDYTVPASEFPDGIVKLFPPPDRYDSNIIITPETTNGKTNSLIIKGQDFWKAARKSLGSQLGEVTLKVGNKDNITLKLN